MKKALVFGSVFVALEVLIGSYFLQGMFPNRSTVAGVIAILWLTTVIYANTAWNEDRKWR